MTFVEALGGHNGETLNEVLGSPNGVRLDKVMDKIEVDVEANPAAAIVLDFDIAADTDLLGKVVTDLQEDMYIDSNGKITGKSKYVTGYTGFSGNKKEQKGNFVAFHVSVGELVIGTDVTVKINDVALDPDGLFVMRFKDSSPSARAIVVVTVTGHPDYEKEFIFSHVVRQPKSN